ncbi:Rad9 domain containing protein [Elaphomyces granulatus]
MATLSFSLNPSALTRFHGALNCLAKFSDSVSIEAEYDQLRLSALNSTKTAYSSFLFDANKFFSRFSFSIRRGDPRNPSSDRFSCQIYLKALLSVFKGRAVDSRDKDTAIERCEVDLIDTPDQAECRLVIKMLCGKGVIKSYRLTYESVVIQHAIFDKARSRNQWKIESKFLREIIEHFSHSAEQLDIYPDGSKAVFTSFTTKVTDGREVLKQPVHTSVTIDKRDFEDFLVEENLHVAINVKDFKAIIIHAESTKAAITARYTRPCRPLQLAYESEGMVCEFTLMTRGEQDEESGDGSPPAAQSSARPPPRPVQISNTPTTERVPSLPSRSARSSAKPPAEKSGPSDSLLKSSAYMDFDSLFVPVDDDRQWGEPNYEDDTEDKLGWDASADLGESNINFERGKTGDESVPVTEQRQEHGRVEDEQAIPPTQRMSQIRGLGLFD